MSNENKLQNSVNNQESSVNNISGNAHTLESGVNIESGEFS